MSPLKDITGQRFGRLVAVEPTLQRSSRGNIIWLCLCDCGKYTLTSSSTLLSGGVKSCKCLKIDRIKQANTVNIEGKRYGRLTALHPTDRRSGGHVVWECLCDCGNITEVNMTSLGQGDTQSCGCLACKGTTYLYCFLSTKIPLLKVGITKNIIYRKKFIQNKLDENLTLFGYVLGTRSQEAKIHRELKSFQATHPNSPSEKEWFYRTEESMSIMERAFNGLNNVGL